MSISLPTVNLAGVAVGQSGKVSFQIAGVDANPAYTMKMPSVLFQNESGTGLNIVFQLSGSDFTLGAGKHVCVPVIPGESGFTWTALYNLPNPPVTLLFTDYYYPNEPPPDTGMLGNSPIGIGGTIAVTNVTALSNETNAANTLVIDIGVTGNTLLLQIFNDHFIWSVLQSGVAHQVLKGQTAGNPLQIGQAADISEVLGNLTVDGTTILTGAATLSSTLQTGTVTFNNGATFAGGDLALNAHNITSSNNILATTVQTNTMNDSSGNSWAGITPGATTRIASNTGGQVVVQLSGVTQVTMNGTDTISQNQVSAPKFILTGSTGNYALYTNSLSRLSNGTMTANAVTQTLSHGLGALPTVVLVWGNAHTSTTTMGSDTYTTTQFSFLGFTTGVPCAFLAMRY